MCDGAVDTTPYCYCSTAAYHDDGADAADMAAAAYLREIICLRTESV